MTTPTDLATPSQPLTLTPLRWPGLLASVLFFAFVFLLLLQTSMHKQLNHDEHMYVSSGVLLLQGEWPYIDYPYFQMPLLTLLYGAAFSIWPDYLLVARLLNVLFAFGACLLLFSFVAKLLSSASPILRFGLAASGVLLYISGSQFVYTSGIAWNHDLPVLLTLAALFLLLPKNPNGPFLFVPLRFILLSGVFLGLATSARSLFILAAAPIAATFLFSPFVPQSLYFLLDSDGRASLRKIRPLYIFRFGTGILLGLLPCLPFLLISPTAFIFGNFTYHGLNEQYWHTLNYERAMTLPTKLSYSFDVLVAEPANWLLILGTIVALLLALRSRGQSFPLYILLSLPIALALFIGALIPTPTWLQYFYAPYALLAITFAICTALLVRKGHPRIIIPLFTLVTLVSAVISLPRYLSLGNLLAFDDWTPIAVSNISREISAKAPTGTVVTLSPIYPLQAGLNIYPALSTGPFGFRVANTLSPSTRQTNNLLSAEDTLAIMNTHPPEAILTGSEGTLELPLIQFATDHLYTQTLLSNGLTLCLRPTP